MDIITLTCAPHSGARLHRQHARGWQMPWSISCGSRATLLWPTLMTLAGVKLIPTLLKLAMLFSRPSQPGSAEHKCFAPATTLEWLGYSINTVEMTAAVPSPKLHEVIDECKSWAGRKRACKKQIQSLAGRLIYLTNCITPARRFTARVLAALRALGERNWITLNEDFHLDLKWFINYAKAANGMFYYTPERKEVEICCDSCLTGGGGVSLNYCYSWVYPDQHRACFPHIHHLEAVNLIFAYTTLAHLVAEPGALLVLSTDNISSSFALESGRTRDMIFASCSRELWLKALANNHLVTIRHKAGL